MDNGKNRRRGPITVGLWFLTAIATILVAGVIVLVVNEIDRQHGIQPLGWILILFAIVGVVRLCFYWWNQTMAKRSR